MTKETIAIIDYGSGNLRSAYNALRHIIKTNDLNAEAIITNNPKDLKTATRIILPGQGAFGDCMNNLKSIDGMIPALEQRVLKDAIPFLGICVGMQLLATKGFEHGEHNGLNWIPGEIIPLPQKPGLKIPHMGWNTLSLNDTQNPNTSHFVLRNTTISAHYYFIHSFMFKCRYNKHSIASCNYGQDFTAIVGRDNIIGMQFHPEKSQETGLNCIHNFLVWKP